MDLTELTTVITAIVSLLGAIGFVANKWKKISKKLPVILGLVTNLQEVVEAFVDPETGKPYNLDELTEKQIKKIVKESYDVAISIRLICSDEE